MTPPTPERAFDADQVDLSNCEREPIHILGTIQTYGYLLALSPDWIVAHASDNIADLLGQTAQEINGVPVADLLPEVSIRKMRAKMQGLLHEDATVRIIDFDLFGDGRRFDAAIHQSGRSFVLEVEQKADLSPDRDDLGAVQALVHRISTRGSMQEMLDQAAQGIRMTVAGRTIWGEDEAASRAGFAALFRAEGFAIDPADPSALVLFPEMDETAEVPEVTTACWGILGKSPEAVMCASSRMVVRRRGAAAPTVLACTLLAYDEAFELGRTLAEADRPVPLNHPHCAKFCVLGGASCSA